MSWAWGNLAEVCQQYLRKDRVSTSKDACRPAVGYDPTANAIPHRAGANEMVIFS